MKFRVNLKGKVIHGPDCGEQCNLDDVDELRTVSFSAAALLRYEQGFSVCERVEKDERDPD